MEINNLSENTSEKGGFELSSEEMAKLFNYPAVGELFSEGDSHSLDEFYRKLSATAENLERVIRYGSKDEAASAERAVGAVKITLDFLKSLEKMRQ